MGKDRFGREIEESDGREWPWVLDDQGRHSLSYPKSGPFTKKNVIIYAILFIVCNFLLRYIGAWMDMYPKPATLNIEREILCTHGNINVSEALSKGFVITGDNTLHADIYLYVRQISRHLSCQRTQNKEILQFVYHQDYLNATDTQIDERITALITQFPLNQTFLAWYYPWYPPNFGAFGIPTDVNHIALKPLYKDRGWIDHLLIRLFTEFMILVLDFSIIMMAISYFIITEPLYTTNDRRCESSSIV